MAFISPTNQYVKMYALGREPCVNADSALRIRVTAPVAVDAYCYALLEV